MPKTGQPQTLGPALATQMQRALTQLEKKIDKLQKMQSDTEILPNSDQPSTESLIKERSITPQEMLTYIENRLDDLKSKTKIEKYQTALQDTRNKITKQSQSNYKCDDLSNCICASAVATFIVQYVQSSASNSSLIAAMVSTYSSMSFCTVKKSCANAKSG
jgi:hypothetical protein